MKGMQKIKRGTSFSGVLVYALDRDDKKQPGWVVGGNIEGHSTDDIIQQFQATSDLRPDIEKPVWHQSLRLPKDEHLSDEKWAEIADDYMTKLGFTQQNPRIYIQHNDRDGEHIHIVASRVSIGGDLYLGQNENLKSTRIIHDLELKHGLTQTKTAEVDKDGKTVMPDKKRLTMDEKEKANREQELPIRRKMQITIDKTIDKISGNGKFTASVLAEKLEQNGIKVNPNIGKTGAFNGFSFSMDDQFYKGSQLGKTYTKNGLTKRGMSYDIENDADKLRRYREQNKDMWNEKPDDENVPTGKTYNVQAIDKDILKRLVEIREGIANNPGDHSEWYKRNKESIDKCEKRIAINDAEVDRYNLLSDSNKAVYKNNYTTLCEEGIVSRLCEIEHANQNVSRGSDISLLGSERTEANREQNKKTVDTTFDYLQALDELTDSPKKAKKAYTQQQEQETVKSKSQVGISF